jgi:hypothetical protein
MASFLGVLRCVGGWGVAKVDVRPKRMLIDVSLARSFPRARRIASPDGEPPCLPETCYAELQGGRPVPAARRTVLGRKQRWKLLQVAYPGLPVPRAPRGMSDADVLDALVLAWAAQETAAGRAPGRFKLMR